MVNWERIGPPIATVSSPWLTVYCERYRDEQNQLLDYWRLQRASSVIVIVIFRNEFILPAPQFRPGLQQCTLDFVGGRRRPGLSIQETAAQLVTKELHIPSGILDSPRVKWILLNGDGKVDARNDDDEKEGWPVDSSVSNQRLYGVVACLNDDDDDQIVSLLEKNANIRKYSVEQVDDLLTDLQCLQCRAVLLEWLHRRGKTA
jgi:hypothetical protein